MLKSFTVGPQVGSTSSEAEGWLYFHQVCAQLFSHVLLFCNFIDCSPTGSSVQGIFPENWSGLSFSPPRDLTNLEVKPMSLVSSVLADRFIRKAVNWKILKKLSNLGGGIDETKQFYLGSRSWRLNFKELEGSCHKSQNSGLLLGGLLQWKKYTGRRVCVDGMVLLLIWISAASVSPLLKNLWITWELGVKFCLGQNEDSSVGGSVSDSFEEVLQGVEGKIQII